jgi:hypothetical protein
LLILKRFILSSWSPQFEEFKGQVLVSDGTKELLRGRLLDLAIGSNPDRKVKSAASLVVSKIASVDFPDQWPALLSTLLHLIPAADDGQLQGGLRVLSDLVYDGIDEDQFFQIARDLVKVLYDIAINEDKKFIRRAMAVSVFRSCFDTLQIVKGDHNEAVKAFVDEVLNQWSPLFIDLMQREMPAAPSEDEENVDRELSVVTTWRGMIALKLQVVKVNLNTPVMTRG